MIENTKSEKKEINFQNNNRKFANLDYASLRNLGSQESTGSSNFNTKLLPGLGTKTPYSMGKAPVKITKDLIQEPKLLTTAKAHIQQHQTDEVSQAQLSNYLGHSSFINSRQITPINPISGSNQRRKNPHSQKNKLNSISSELFDIESNPDEYLEKNHAKYKHKDFIIYDKLIGQSQIVYHHVFGRQRNVNPKIIHLWKDCLSHSDKTQIYISTNQNLVSIPYTYPRIYALNEIEKGFKEIYGNGKNRSLKIGEESIIIEGINRYLRLCSQDPLKISRKDFDIITTILTDCKMLELQVFPLCMRQIQTHFKIMATKWKYSGKLNLNDKMMETALIVGKNNFIDLGKDGLLSAYLLRNSNIDDL